MVSFWDKTKACYLTPAPLSLLELPAVPVKNNYQVNKFANWSISYRNVKINKCVYTRTKYAGNVCCTDWDLKPRLRQFIQPYYTNFICYHFPFRSSCWQIGVYVSTISNGNKQQHTTTTYNNTQQQEQQQQQQQKQRIIIQQVEVVPLKRIQICLFLPVNVGLRYPPTFL